MNLFRKRFQNWIEGGGQKFKTNKTTLLLVLSMIALSSIYGALRIYSYFGTNISTSMTEVAKVLMNLGAGVIIGGLVKILLDDFRGGECKKR